MDLPNNYFRHLERLSEKRETAVINIRVAESFSGSRGLAHGTEEAIKAGVLRAKQTIDDIDKILETTHGGS